MNNVDVVIEKLAKLNSFSKGNGASEELIEIAERKLGITFSPQYRYFLKKYGWIDGEGYEIFGIIDSNFNGSDVVGATLNMRGIDEFNMKWIVFHNLSEETVSFDYNRINEDGEPTVFYNLVAYQREDVAKDFASYLEKLYEEMKEW